MTCAHPLDTAGRRSAGSDPPQIWKGMVRRPDWDTGGVSIEYTLLAAFIAAVVAAAIFALHGVVAGLFTDGSNAFP